MTEATDLPTVQQRLPQNIPHFALLIQCDQMASLIFNILPFPKMKICQKRSVLSKLVKMVPITK